MKFIFSLIFGLFGLVLLVIPCLVISFLILITSKGPVIHWSERVGRNNVIFKMPKFRTMKVGSPQLETGLLEDVDSYLSLFGAFLRRTSLDELPQIYSIIKGDMCFVGPRPALFNQKELIALRTLHNVDKLVPGLTGWAQINGRDELSIAEKVALDVEYMTQKSFRFDMKIIVITFLKVIKRDGVVH